MRDVADGPRADDHVRPPLHHRRDQRGKVRRRILVVGVVLTITSAPARNAASNPATNARASPRLIGSRTM